MIQGAIGLITSAKNAATKAWAVDKNDAELIQGFEGLRLKAYLDIAGIPTIGWGNTRYLNGKKVKMGDTITREQADELLKATVAQFEADVRRLVKVPINDNQGAALLSFHYNTGALAGSTLLKLLNNREYIRAGLEFIKWNKITVNGVKKVSQTLVKRRKQEQELFYKPIYHV